MRSHVDGLDGAIRVARAARLVPRKGDVDLLEREVCSLGLEQIGDEAAEDALGGEEAEC